MNEILKIPFAAFNYDWDDLQLFLKHRGNPPYEITDNLYLGLRGDKIKSLGNLTSVGGDLFLSRSKIQSLGNLTSVEGTLDLYESKIEDLGKLKYVGGDLILKHTTLLDKYTKEEIRSMVEVGGRVYI
jgi:hypothetical protein